MVGSHCSFLTRKHVSQMFFKGEVEQELQETARVFTFKFDGDLEILMRRRVGRGVSSLPGNPPFRLFSGRGSSSGARIYVCARDASRAVYNSCIYIILYVYTYNNYTRAHTYLFPVLRRFSSSMFHACANKRPRPPRGGRGCVRELAETPPRKSCLRP